MYRVFSFGYYRTWLFSAKEYNSSVVTSARVSGVDYHILDNKTIKLQRLF